MGCSANSLTFPPLHLCHGSFSNPSVPLPMSQIIFQPFGHFVYVTAQSPTLPSLYLCHSSFSNPSVTSHTSQLILQPFRRFTYVTAYSLTVLLLHLRHSSFPNPSFACPMSQALHLRHLESRPWSLTSLCARNYGNKLYSLPGMTTNLYNSLTHVVMVEK